MRLEPVPPTPPLAQSEIARIAPFFVQLAFMQSVVFRRGQVGIALLAVLERRRSRVRSLLYARELPFLPSFLHAELVGVRLGQTECVLYQRTLMGGVWGGSWPNATRFLH